VCEKVKWSCSRPAVAQRVGRGIALLFHDRGTRRGWVVSSTPWPHFTPGKDPVPILQEAVWGPGPIWTGEKPRTRTVQPVVSRYTDWATWPIYIYIYIYIYMCVCVCVYTHIHTYVCMYVYTYIYVLTLYIYIYMCVCVYVHITRISTIN